MCIRDSRDAGRDLAAGAPDVTRVTVAAPSGYTHSGVIGNLQSLYYLVQGVGGNTIASEPSVPVGKFDFILTPGS